MRKKPRFTHVRANLRGDVSGKRFSTHVVEVRWLELEMAGLETTKGWKVSRESDGKRVGRGWRVCRESDGKRVEIQMCDWAGRSCGVGKQGKTRVRALDAPTRGTVTWVPSLDTATEYSHRAPSQGTSHRVLARGTDMGL